jgi:hypothetical protein
MKFQVICRTDGSVEVHARDCREVTWENYYSDGIVDAANPFGAAVETLGGDERAAFDALLFPCLAPDYAAPEALRRPRRPTRRAVPFDPADSADPEVIDACTGKRLKWVNGHTDREEDARLYPEGPHEKLISGRVVTSYPHNHTKITVAADGRRILNFLDAGGTGFRAVALDAIVSVR